MIRAVFFDVGGTLHTVHREDALAEQFAQNVLYHLEKHGMALPVDAAALVAMLRQNAEEYKHWSEEHRIELPNSRIWSEFYLKEFHLSVDCIAPVSEDLSVWYDACRVRNKPRPHLQETFQTLHDMGLVQGVISNIISTTFVPQLMEDYGLAPYLCCVVMSSTAGIRKPDPGIFELAAARSGIPLSQMAYVGDTLSRDVLGCRNAGVGLCIQIRNPAIAHRDIAFMGTGLQPDAHIEDLAEIPDIIRRKNSGS